MADSTQEQKRAVLAWTLYDWANSAFATTIMAAVLPVYYSTVAAATLAPSQATAYWGFTTSLAALLAAVVSPVLGAVADFKAAKKRFLCAFMMLGATATAFLFFVRRGDWPLASALFVLANLGFAGSLVFYDALLPHVASADNVDQVSSRGFAMGYAGGGILLAINILMIELAPRFFQLPEDTLMVRLSFVSVAAWWALFSIPIFWFVSEPPRRVFDAEAGLGAIRVAFRRLAQTARSVRQFRDLSLFLLASWLYFNGIGTIIVMATVYGSEVGISRTTLIGTLLMVQFVAIPFAMLFGALAERIGAKPAIQLGLGAYAVIAVAGYFLKQEWHFWALGAAVATVQGGTQALSRSLFSRLMPASRSAEFYGFFSVMEKLSAIIGPAMFGIVTTLTGSSRFSIVSLVAFFVAGMALLARVDVGRGIETARRAEQRLE